MHVRIELLAMEHLSCEMFAHHGPYGPDLALNYHLKNWVGEELMESVNKVAELRGGRFLRQRNTTSPI
jgi:hypothetical protein